MQCLLEVKELFKSYSSNEVIHGVDFGIKRGEILCLLGPNGAGKSTIINSITGALGIDSGDIMFKGSSIFAKLNAYKQNIGIVPQDLAIYEDLTAEKNVLFFASLYGLKGNELIERSEYALEFTGLLDRAKDKVKTFSGGMKRRLNIACAIAHKPELLIMDEPSVGIDPQSRELILERVRLLRDEGMTILYTTHYMEEFEKISTRIIIMDDGRIIADGTNDELKADVINERRYIIDVDFENSPSMKGFEAIEGVQEANLVGNRIKIISDKSVENLDRIISECIASGVSINDLTTEQSSLETVFLNLTGKSLRN